MEAKFFDDWRVGETIETMGRTVGEAEISQFVSVGGFFEELFINQDYMTKSGPYPTRIAPGALTFAFSEGLIILTGCIHRVGLALLSVEKMNFKRPLMAGDTIHVRVTVLDTQTTSKPDRGIVTFTHSVINQRSEEIMECIVKRMLRRRPA
ncbi:MAG: MaoC/PaaZ C-terminal domain-containing protein [Candidatus Binataceae bacterium]